ncbi:neutral alpha-glucosidase AB-like [Ochlerotatus camptorhynchus]|uniref:neutral alpha-glucosidase AB-like n=1 Tax=Ochlerotatus camptorhynchus TaxID=644619 RepID=UPI0031D4354C
MATRQAWRLKCFALLFLLNGICAVDHSIFKKCHQSGFCRRFRRFESQESTFRLDSHSLNIHDNVVSMDLQDSETNHWYILSLSSIHEKIFHFEINEKHPLTDRYRVTDALAGELNPRGILIESSNSVIAIRDDNKRVIIQIEPFRMDFYHKNQLMVSVNAKGMLRYEYLREKPAKPADGEWEEEFNGFVDTKPRGPESLGVDFTFHQAEILFGIPEHADDFVLKETIRQDSDPYRLYTLDTKDYEVDSKMALYGAIPVLYSHGASGSSGIFWHNSAETWIDASYEDDTFVNIFSESGILDAFVMLGPSPIEAFQQYTFLTGNAPLPQMYTLGYHQSRWNYDNDSDVAMIDSKFEEYGIPLDTIWLDIEYTDGKRYFTWDHENFPNPMEMISNLTKNSRHLILIIDPHVKIDKDYFFHQDCTSRDYYVKDRNGEDFRGQCWPGPSSYTDFFNPDARKYYADQYLLENFKESSLVVNVWNDMNEPAVFENVEVTMPKDNLHYGGWEHRDVHNMYGFYHTMATYDGLTRRNEGLYRPFVLTRSFFAGSQRYSAVWTGDNTAGWDHLRLSIKMCLSLSVSGISFVGADVGGFFEHPSAELISRWYQLAAFQPFYRSHANQDTPRREPWMWPTNVQIATRNSIQKRYSMLPFWYTSFFEHERNGAPIMRPMLTQYPNDPVTFRIESQYLLGDQYLVAPVLYPGQTSVNVYFPLKEDGRSDLWYDIDDFQLYKNSGFVSIPVDELKIPVFQRGGTIIPIKRIARKSSMLMRSDPYTLVVALNCDGYATGTLYVDDEESMEYRNGKYLYKQFEFKNNTLYSRTIDVTASYDTDTKIGSVIIIGIDNLVSSVNVYSKGRDNRITHFSMDRTTLAVENILLSVDDDWRLELN